MITDHNQNDALVAGTGIIGTIAAWTLQNGLSVLATICTLIVVGPKAWEQLTVWWNKITRRKDWKE